jgi:hypothetical protein
MRLRTTVLLGGKTATGLVVPDDVVSRLGSGKRPKITVTLNGYSYRTTIAPMGGRFMAPLSAENREAAGVAAGDDVEIDVELDTAPREVAVPPDFAAALGKTSQARQVFDALAYSHRKEWVRWIEEAKKDETRLNRIATAVASLEAGKRVR